MSEKKSMFIFAGAREAQQKFDYFITGVAGALFAYIAQTYAPKELALAPSSLEPFALVSLALAFYFGLRRIEASVVVMRLNHEMLDYQEKAGNMTKAMSEGRGSGFNPHSGDIIHGHEIPARREAYMQQAKAAESRAESAANRGERHYARRNLFLYSGFAAIFLAKLLQPYA
jgi:hypothetical protein